MHYPLKRLMTRQLPQPTLVQAVFPANDIIQNLGQKGHLYGPGDQLTLLYIFHPEITATERETLLAARALIYSKIIIKEELNADITAYPHLQDELICINATRELSVNDCSRLFARIRGVNTFDARRIVAEHIMSSSPHLSQYLKNGRHRFEDVMGQQCHEAATL
jgi:hypothetical protein